MFLGLMNLYIYTLAFLNWPLPIKPPKTFSALEFRFESEDGSELQRQDDYNEVTLESFDGKYSPEGIEEEFKTED